MSTTNTTYGVAIPSVPADLIVPLEKMNELNPVVLRRQDGSVYQMDWYRVYTSNQELTNWIIEHFPIEVELVEYVVSDRGIFMHTDLGRDCAYNYLIDAGGINIVTEFYNTDQIQLLDSIEYQTNKWYKLNVGTPHQVVGTQTRPRFLISVTPKAGITYRF
ncbi:hypothetical protein [Haliscomenobacter sp.]|uniref:hypothetical protein n=1 Tax=Haliscomenobacter sp. TaxID=2717303 RepID=UPI003364BD14